MCSGSQKRVLKDLQKLEEEPPAGVSAAPNEHNVMEWNAIIIGPGDTPFEDGIFRLTLKFTELYPNEPPKVRFLSEIFHPNVYCDGSICLDVLGEHWSPAYDATTILLSIQSLLGDPNPNSPANYEAATLFIENIKEYRKKVRICVEKTFQK
ncbi:Ubiquitin-conjugating enzyme E2-17 kDa [Gryllus bimaculatus]|nr:Ubiquitin-conjugating enzyme E2-17 kDa [Gryllus bimaculatus]